MRGEKSLGNVLEVKRFSPPPKTTTAEEPSKKIPTKYVRELDG
jgi:hypothetical protein